MEPYPREIFNRYLKLLWVERADPNWHDLARLASAHLRRIPFENSSKIYRVRIQGIRGIPALDGFLDGVERYNFGGTCYTNNCSMRVLLSHLHYQARLCSADISVNRGLPEGHMVNVVTIGGREGSLRRSGLWRVFLAAHSPGQHRRCRAVAGVGTLCS